jgi:hypothetical protein
MVIAFMFTIAADTVIVLSVGHRLRVASLQNTFRVSSQSLMFC